MQAKIETLKAKNSNDEEYLVYPRTLIKCVTNEHGENLEEKINDTILASEGKVFVDYGDREVTENYIPLNADTLEGHRADYFATAEALGTAIGNKVDVSTVDNIINGTTAVGNTLKLGGKGASEYALAEELTKHSLSYNSFSTQDALVTFLNNYSADIADDSFYEFELSSVSGYELDGGAWHVCGVKINSLYEIQTAKRYLSDRVLVKRRSKNNGTWSSWVADATELDLADYLPLSGGTATSKTFGKALSIYRDSSTESPAIAFENATGLLGYLGVQGGSKVPRFWDVDKNEYELLHTGNKPSGTYTGNGSSSTRTVSIGGVGSVVVIWNDSNKRGTIVYPNGAFYVNPADGTFEVATENTVTFKNGVLSIGTNKAFINSDGVTYTYQVL